jgi:hypothetical protein
VTFDDCVIQNIITNNQFGISQVLLLKPLNSLFFNQEEYSKISKLMKEKDISSVEKFTTKFKNREYLEVMQFIDQNKKSYIVTIYDSQSLEQDPQVIEMFNLG